MSLAGEVVHKRLDGGLNTQNICARCFGGFFSCLRGGGGIECQGARSETQRLAAERGVLPICTLSIWVLLIRALPILTLLTKAVTI